MTPVNDNNFIRWYSGSGQTMPLASPLPCPGLRADYIKPYYQQPTKVYKPVIAPGEEFSFFMNSETPPDHNTADLRLAVVSGANTVETFPDVSFYSNPDGAGEWLYRNITLSATSNKTVQLVIYRNSDSVVLYFSNPLQVMQQDEAEAKTVKAEYSNSRNIYFLPYVNISFVQKIRLHLYMTGIEPESNTQNYRAINTGNLRNYKTEPDMAYTFRTGAFDLEAHRAMNLMTFHDDIKLNGRNYIRKDDYTTNWTLTSILSSGTLSLYETEFSAINRYDGSVRAGVDGLDIRTIDSGETVRVTKKDNPAT
jgi:hypothetical protein